MMNQYPAWKYLLIAAAIFIGAIYALPNIFPNDAAIQISVENSANSIDQSDLEKATRALSTAGIEYFGEELTNNTILLRMSTPEDQLRAKEVLSRTMGLGYVVALNLAPTTPDWLANIGAAPMKLGLDLSGGIHFLMEVNMKVAINNRLNGSWDGIRKALREARIFYNFQSVKVDETGIRIGFSEEALRQKARAIIEEDYADFLIEERLQGDQYFLILTLPENIIAEIEDYAVDQNITTLRNRVNELGVSEPLVQRQGRNRIVVELPGLLDSTQAKVILGKTATLEFRMEAETDDEPRNTEVFKFKDPQQGISSRLKKEVVVSGDQVINAQPSFDQDSRPIVNITLNGEGGSRMLDNTQKNVGRKQAVLFVETKQVVVNGVEETIVTKEIISLATIQGVFGNRFIITGLNQTEAYELALLLRAGALVAPMKYVEERTVGPALGRDNIERGMNSMIIGGVLVLIFMVFYYKGFGLAANIALIFNIILLLAIMSILKATLTLPGIAGIVLTVGMAVDANVLIFARIKEELANKLSPQAAINTGFDRAFITIVDANITTFIAAIILFAVGTGPVKGFAITLSIGIVTSMFTAILGTRALINLFYGGRNLKTLSI